MDGLATMVSYLRLYSQLLDLLVQPSFNEDATARATPETTATLFTSLGQRCASLVLASTHTQQLIQTHVRGVFAAAGTRALTVEEAVFVKHPLFYEIARPDDQFKVW